MSANTPLRDDQISLAYELLLNRKASAAEIENFLSKKHDLQSMRDVFLNSTEFSKIYAERQHELEVRRAGLKAMPKPAIVHLHIPKSAGTSLTAALAPNFSIDKRLSLEPPQIPELAAKPAGERMKIGFVFGHLQHGVGEVFPQGCIYVSALRKPGPRILSYLGYLRRRSDHPLHKTVTKGNMSFGDFLEFCNTDVGQRMEVDSGQIRRLAGMMAPKSIGHEQAVFQQALSHAFAPNMIFGLTEHFELLLQDLVERKLIDQGKSIIANAAPEKANFEAAYDELQPNQRELLDRFTYWDQKFYDICETYLFGRQTS